MDPILIYAVVVNFVSLFLYGIDKWNAIHDRRRIPEKTLIGIAAIGGSIGAYAGMQMFRHKIRKPKFYIGVPIILAIQAAVLIYIYR